jgi:hypothetical protein
VLVFIDESGCPGFKLTKGSTTHFVLALVIFEDPEAAETTAKCIKDVRAALGFRTEFKFSKSADRVRTQFFQSVRDCNFSVRAIVVDKAIIYSHKLKEDSDTFYNFFVRLILGNDGGVLADAKVKIDGSGDREFKRELNSYLRKTLPSGLIKDVRFVDSTNNDLIQLADMCAGAILRAYRHDDKKNVLWFQALKKRGRIQDVWNFR